MKLLIASDIHGSAYYCERMLKIFEEEQADRMLLLGDILYHGPRNDLPRDYAPKKVVELLKGYREKIFCVRGNCDAEVDQLMFEFPMMGDYAILDVGKETFFLTHGHLWNEIRLPPLGMGTVLAHGHTHIPELKRLECGLTIFNPGSVSLPKGGSRHSCILLKDGIFGWKDIETGDYFRHYDSLGEEKQNG